MILGPRKGDTHPSISPKPICLNFVSVRKLYLDVRNVNMLFFMVNVLKCSSSLVGREFHHDIPSSEGPHLTRVVEEEEV